MGPTKLQLEPVIVGIFPSMVSAHGGGHLGTWTLIFNIAP